ncbi:uncharacterized protein LOC134530133 [Bacillus rossius redtenbacheri]|uniref:uncharacterized protein LOC134530133 n=1 Tax=Bacillus rossius redtenbacheri TaxID=93214 RepID=UPI002FDD7542
MHFWIDKRSQACGFSGRHRVPAPLCAQHRRRSRRPRGKPMVTPVHRFQPIECTGGGQHGRRAARQLHASAGLAGPAAPGARASELDSSVFLDVPLEDNANAPPRAPQLLPVGRLKCGMWATFALASVFVAGAKFYFNHQGAGLEVLVFCALLVALLLAGCTALLCRARTTPAPVPPPAVPAPVPAPVLAPVPPAPPPELPPPPYHVAVLLPAQPEDAPPPPYDKAVS